MNEFEIPYARQSITEEDINAVTKVLRERLITQGPSVNKFEDNFRKLINTTHAISCNSATSALHLSCLALDLGSNDTVWTTPISFVASANCARYCGANIDFVDINKDSGLMCINALREKLADAKNNNRLPKIIIPVHLAGTSCNMEQIFELSKIYKFKILEDASHALGGKYQDDFVGSCKFSDICVFSFHPVKIITTGEGGMITTNNEKYASKIKNLRSHGITKDSEKYEFKSLGPWYYEQHELGFNYRMTDIQASLGISQLERLSSIVKERNNLINYYKTKLQKFPLKFLAIPDDVYSSIHLCVVQLEKTKISSHLNIFSKLHEKGIKVQLHYLPIHLQPYYRKLGFKENDFPIAEKYSQKSISLPLYPGLNRSQQDYVIETLLKILEEY